MCVLQRHLIPGLLAEHGLAADQLVFPSDSIRLIAHGYTREVSFTTCDVLELCAAAVIGTTLHAALIYVEQH